jgi:predicted phosphodiesterase
MKIACVSDSHSHAPPAIQNVDFWLHAGDIYDGRYKGLHDGWLKMKEIYAVRGNHDYYDHKSFLKTNDISGIVREVRPKFFIVGIGWCSNKYYDLPTESDMAKCCHEVLRQCLFKMKDGSQSIILSHYGPLTNRIIGGGSKEGWFYESIQKVVEAIRPIAIVHGHTHDLAGQAYVKDGTLYVCTGPKGGILDTQSSTFSITPTQ